MRATSLILAVAFGFMFAGCGMYNRKGIDPARVSLLSQTGSRMPHLSRELEERVLALNPTNVTAQDVKNVLSHTPAPRIINIHGGIYYVIPRMESFADFLIGMGYPAASLTNASDGTYTFSCYESSEKIAGVVGWYYEHEGLRPMLNGHSQGGMQVVKVLHLLATADPSTLRVWSPLTWKPEDRCEITDPLTGQTRPLAGLQLPYATAVGAGGLTRVLPNQWDMTARLHDIPDTAEEFTGFCKEMDPIGGDFLGYGSANHYRATGTAAVRNVWLPTKYKHGSVPDTRHLLKSPEVRDWIDRYRPPEGDVVRLSEDNLRFDADTQNLLWAADVWYSIKKHWVMELQRMILAQHPQHHDS